MSPLGTTFTRFRHGARLLRTNPSVFLRRVLAELKAPFYRRRPPVQRVMRGVVFEFDFRFDAAIKLMYEEIYEPDMVNAMKKLLTTGDTFIDVGANIGYISAVGLGLVGTSGHVHSFEPVPEFFGPLSRLKALNPSYSFTPNQCALGESGGTASINVSNVANIGWNTMVPGMMSKESVRATITVPVTTLSNYIREHELSRIRLIKIDTEGFEYPVLKGLLPYLQAQSERPALLVEIAPTAYRLLGTSLNELGDLITSLGYNTFDIHDHAVPVTLSSLTETTNVLFFPAKG